MSGATVRGPGSEGLYISSLGTNACVNNNTFVAGTGLSSAISSNGSGDIGSGNILNGLSSNLTPRTCGPSRVTLSISPTAATVASRGTPQVTPTLTRPTHTA